MANRHQHVGLLNYGRAARFGCLAAGLTLWAVSWPATAEDWPRWRGPNINGISTETGWQSRWSGTGPKRLWEAQLGVGFSSFSVSQGRVYTMGNIDDTDIVWCFNATNGQVLWKHQYPCSAKDPNDRPGPRCTPTVDGDRVYTVSRDGQFFCLDAARGTVLWSTKFTGDFGAKAPTWGFSGSPLIENDWVLYEVGAPGASVVAFDKKTGAVIWKNGDDSAAYSSLVPFEVGGQRYLAQFPKDAFVVRRMKDGSEVARIAWKTSYGVNAATPIVQDNRLFISSGYGYGCALLELSSTSLKELWRNKNMRNHVNSCVLWQGHLYGFDESELKCLDYKTGEVKWADKSFGKGSLMIAGGTLIVYSDRGKVATVRPSPDRLEQLASAQVLTGRDTWAVPVLANGRLYCRNLDHAVCLDLTSN